VRKKPEIPSALPAGEDLGAEDGLEGCLLLDLRTVLDGYKRSGLTMAAVTGCVSLLLQEELEAMREPYARDTETCDEDEGEDWKAPA
jgi:hypothetical protein